MNETLLEFEEQSALLTPNERERSRGCTIVDVLAEGRPQILCTTTNGPNHLYRWDDETSHFIDAAPEALADPAHNGVAAACGDADGDGRLDIYLINANPAPHGDDEPDRLLLQSEGGAWTDVLRGGVDRNWAPARSVCWVDPRGDGHHMAYVSNFAQPNRFFGLMSRKGEVRDFAPMMGVDFLAGGRGLVAAPVLGGPRSDIFVVNESGPNLLFNPEPGAPSGETAVYRDLAPMLGLSDDREHARGIVAADLNRDGMLDIVCANWEGPHRLYEQHGDGVFANTASQAFAEPSRARSVIAADFDNDGWEEIFFNNLGEPNRLFHRTPEGGWAEQTPFAIELANGYGTGACVGDLNGDGFLDLFIAQGDPEAQTNALFFGVPNGNHWLRILPLTPAGAPAIGARITLPGPHPQTRVIDGGSGSQCQMEPIAHFGLGDTTGARLAHIQWPDGTETTLRDLDANQTVTVGHPGA